MGEFFCLLHSSNIAIPWENNFPFKHLLLRRMLEALNASNLGMVVILLELCYFLWSVEPFFERKRKRKSYSCDQFWLQSLRDENYVLLLMVCRREEFQSRGIFRSLKVVQGRPLNKNCKVLLLQQSNLVYLYRLGTEWLSSNPAVRALQDEGCQAES